MPPSCRSYSATASPLWALMLRHMRLPEPPYPFLTHLTHQPSLFAARRLSVAFYCIEIGKYTRPRKTKPATPGAAVENEDPDVAAERVRCASLPNSATDAAVKVDCWPHAPALCTQRVSSHCM